MEEIQDQNIIKLKALGFSDNDITALIKSLQQDITISMLMEFAEELSEEEFDEFGKNIEGLSEIERVSEAAKLYSQKTGKSPIEGALVIQDRYLTLLVKAIGRLKDLGEKLAESDKTILVRLEKAVQNGNWNEIKPILDEIGFDSNLLAE